MSATIVYQPSRGVNLKIGAPSSFLSALERLAGKGPWTFYTKDCLRLEAFSAGLSSEDQREAALELSEAAFKHGEIRVWAEY
jgi:hypothetical protein